MITKNLYILTAKKKKNTISNEFWTKNILNKKVTIIISKYFQYGEIYIYLSDIQKNALLLHL